MPHPCWSRRDFLKTTTVLGASALVPACSRTDRPQIPDRPNIVLIMADDLGYECIGANGGTSYQTPVLDRMARTGIRFEHCYAQPLCTPSRVQIMTGLYNVRNYTDFGVLDRDETTFAHLLQSVGYATCVAGKWQLGTEPDSPQHFGFDTSCLWQHTRGRTDVDGHDTRYPNPTLDINGRTVHYTQGEYGPDAVTDFACDFMQRHQDRPFFLYYPMILTHCPFVPTSESQDWDPASPGPTEYKGDPHYFDDMVRYMDTLVGRITDKLTELGLHDNTLVLFTGDNVTDTPVVSILNGREVAGGKKKMTDAGTRVPLIARWPGVIPEGQVFSDLIDFTDVLPTLCETADAAIPDRLDPDGRSFLPQLLGQNGTPREWGYCWFARNADSTPQEWARTQRYKLYRSGEFYDVQNDVLEHNPLPKESLDADAQQVRAMLQSVLDRFEDAW